MDEYLAVAVFSVFWTEFALFFAFPSWWTLIIQLVIVLGFCIAWLIAKFIVHCLRIRRERRYKIALRKKKIAALIRNAETQNEYLHAGLVNEDQQKINLGTYGNYQPVELEG